MKTGKTKSTMIFTVASVSSTLRMILSTVKHVINVLRGSTTTAAG